MRGSTGDRDSYHRVSGCFPATVNSGVTADGWKQAPQPARVIWAESAEPSDRGSCRRRLRSYRHLPLPGLTAAIRRRHALAKNRPGRVLSYGRGVASYMRGRRPHCIVFSATEQTKA